MLDLCTGSFHPTNTDLWWAVQMLNWLNNKCLARISGLWGVSCLLFTLEQSYGAGPSITYYCFLIEFHSLCAFLKMIDASLELCKIYLFYYLSQMRIPIGKKAYLIQINFFSVFVMQRKFKLKFQSHQQHTAKLLCSKFNYKFYELHRRGNWSSSLIKQISGDWFCNRETWPHADANIWSVWPIRGVSWTSPIVLGPPGFQVEALHH